MQLVRFGVNMISTGKNKTSKLFGRGQAILVNDLKVSNQVGIETKTIPILKIEAL